MATPSKTARRGKPPAGWKAAFLEALRQIPNVRHACRASGVSRATAYREQERDAGFAEAWSEAVAEGVDVLELEAIRRGMVGVERPVHLRLGKNPKTGQVEYQTVKVREYSDALLQFVLRAAKPEKYRESAALYAEAMKQAIREVIAESQPQTGMAYQTAEQHEENQRRFASRHIDGRWVPAPAGGWPAALNSPKGGTSDA